MPVFETQLFLFDQGRVFSETYYHAGPDFPDAMRSLDRLASSRQGLVGGKVEVGRLRVARVPADRNVLECGVRAHPPRAEGREPWDSVIVDLYAKAPGSGRLYQRAMSMRGLPKGLRDKGSPWWNVLRQHLALLPELGFRMQCYDRDKRAWQVTTISQAADDGGDCAGNPIGGAAFPDGKVALGIGTRLPHDIPARDPFTGRAAKVKLFGAVWQWPDGTKERLYAVALTVLSVAKNLVVVRARLPAAGRLLTPGKVKLASYAYYPIVSSLVKYDPTRKTGGRSKVKPSVLPPFADTPNPPAPAPPVVEPEPTPEVPDPLPPEVPAPPPIERILHSARDVVMFVAEGYVPQKDGKKYQIRIARVLNYKDAWFVGASGTDLSVDQSTGICEDILAGIGAGDTYVATLWEWVQRLIPKGSSVFLAGDSLGGMEVQNLIKFLESGGYKAVNLTTFNSPQTTWFYFCDHNVRFAVYGDLVISASAVGLISATLGNPEQTFLPGDEYAFDPVKAHRAIYDDAALDSYDALGYETEGGTRRELDLGFINLIQAQAAP